MGEWFDYGPIGWVVKRPGVGEGRKNVAGVSADRRRAERKRRRAARRKNR